MKKPLILKAFSRLATELKQQGIRGEIGVVGGAAMVLAFNARSATKDVDAVFEPASKLRAAIESVAIEMDLPKDWLNDAVKGFLPGEPKHKTVLFSKGHLTVWIPEPQYLLAMKGMAARFDSADGGDLRILIVHLKLKRADEVFEIIQNYYPKGTIPPKTQFFVEEIFEPNSKNPRIQSKKSVRSNKNRI